MRCGIALGSNVGDRLAHLAAARDALEKLHTGTQAPLVSQIYETEPVDCAPGTVPFLNAVMEIETTLEPLALLHALHRIERELGRPAEHGHHTPRTIDLDLLYAGGLTLATPELTLPHPRLPARRFVLAPLADIRPGLILPGFGASIAEILAQLPPGQPANRLASWNHL